jgi:hypothetical protein
MIVLAERRVAANARPGQQQIQGRAGCDARPCGNLCDHFFQRRARQLMRLA